MEKMTAENRLKRAEKAFERQSNWRSTLEQAYLYAHPQVNVLNSKTEGAQKNTHLFTGFGQVTTRKAVNRFMNAVFPAEQNFCVMKSGPGVPEPQVKQRNEQLQEASEKMFSVIHHRSNFQTAAAEMVSDLWISTGIMTVQKGRDIARPVSYVAIPQHQVALDDGPEGSVGDKYRKYKLKPGLVAQTWKDAKISEKMKERIQNMPDADIELVECVEVNFDDDTAKYWVIDCAEKEYIVERQMRFDPFAVGRLMKAPNEVNGRGPVFDALPDIKTANKLVELVLKNASVVVSGAWTVVDDGVVNPSNVVIGPNRMIPVAKNPGHPSGPSIAPLERNGNFDVAYMEYDRLKAEITDALLATDLPDYQGMPKTAAEILARVRQYVEDTGAFYGRVNREIVLPIVQKTLNIMANDWQMIDDIVIDGNFVNLEITSPLAIQQAVREVEATVQAIELSKTLFGPEQTAIVFDIKEVMPWIARKLNVPEKFIRDLGEQEGIEAGIGQKINDIEQVKPGAGVGLVQKAMQGSI